MPWDISNPHKPEIVGPELLPVRIEESIPLDLSLARVQLGEVEDAFPTLLGGVRGRVQTTASGTSRQHLYLAELYPASVVDLPVTPQRIVMPVTSGSLIGPASFVGAGNVQDALAAAGDGAYIRLPDDPIPPGVEMNFDTTPLQNVAPQRIVHMAIEYALYKTDSAVGSPPIPTPDLSVFVRWDAVPGSIWDIGIPPSSDEQAVSEVREWSLGEINGLEALTASSPSEAWPWTINEIALADTVGVPTRELQIERFGAFNNGVHQAFDYLVLVAYVVPERRVAVGGFRFSTGLATIAGVNPPGGQSGTELRAPNDVAPTGSIPALTFPPGDYGFSVREALPPDPDFFKDFTVSPFVFDTAALGPGVDFVALRAVQADGLNPQAVPAKVLYQDGVPAAGLELEDTLYPSVALRDEANPQGAFWPHYAQVMEPPSNTVFAANPQSQVLEDVPLASTYEFVRFLVRKPVPTTTPLNVAVGGSTAALSSTGYDALPDVGGGWRLATLQLVPAFVGAGVDATVTFTSVAIEPDAWQVAGTIGPADGQYDPPAVPPFGTPVEVLHVTLHTQPDVPDGLSLAIDTTPVVGGALCCADEINNVEVSWTPSGTGWDVAIERRIQFATDWLEIARVPDIDGEFIDREAPLGVVIDYRLRECRTDLDNICSDPSAVEQVGPLDDGGCAFVLGANDEEISFAYAPTSSSLVRLPWQDRNNIEIIDLHGHDYPASLREPEQRGLTLTFDVTIEAFACEETRSALSPRPYDVLRDHARLVDKWALRLPDGELRYVTMQLGTLPVTTEAGIYNATIIFTEVDPPVYAPEGGGGGNGGGAF